MGEIRKMKNEIWGDAGIGAVVRSTTHIPYSIFHISGFGGCI